MACSLFYSIINSDYLRKYTLDKQIETIIKTQLTSGEGKTPTVVSPKQYKERFRAAMWTYFVLVPDRYTKIITRAISEAPESKESGT